MHFDVLVVNGHVVVPDQGPRRLDLGIAGEQVAAVLEPGASSAHTAARTIDAAGRHVFPGLVDPHTHFGLAAGLADWGTESRSAAAGGVTTVLNFLMSGEPYDAEYRETREAADRQSHVDYGLHLCPSTPAHLAEMPRYMSEYGITLLQVLHELPGSRRSLPRHPGHRRRVPLPVPPAGRPQRGRGGLPPHREHRGRLAAPQGAPGRRRATTCRRGTSRAPTGWKPTASTAACCSPARPERRSTSST